ncbi:Uncharacterized membrane protein YdjX, TVP38/TMEM64 family, SNARE-associated domain [Lachnospiraceae bacterium C7]|nr:Uncharacterized membrane protein YdjX, TVP38/TMEM64 family, SNARE-associated domain [Lachnospiraceae bacterium C7]
MLIMILVIFVFSLLIWHIVKPLLTLAANPKEFRSYINSKGFLGFLLFIGAVILQVIAAIIPGGPLEIAAGYTCGVFVGTFICDIAMTIGSTLAFLFVKKFGFDIIEIFFPKEKIESVKIFENNSKNNKKIAEILFILFLVPGTPKDLLSYFSGLTNISLKSWIIICFVGRFPAIFLSCLSGDSLYSRNYFLFTIISIAILLLSIVGIYIYNRHNKTKQE